MLKIIKSLFKFYLVLSLIVENFECLEDVGHRRL